MIKHFTLLATLLLCSVVFAKIVSAADTYPYPNAPTCPGSCTPDPWAFFKRECVSYAAWKVNEAGTVFHNGMQGPNGNSGWFGLAKDWDNNALVIGFSVTSFPSPGNIAVWEANEHFAGAAGHVAYVESVNGNQVQVSDYNWVTHAYDIRTFTLGNSISASKFINLGGICSGGANKTISGTISSGQVITCSASQSITLTPGFHAQSGSNVRFYIQ